MENINKEVFDFYNWYFNRISLIQTFEKLEIEKLIEDILTKKQKDIYNELVSTSPTFAF